MIKPAFHRLQTLSLAALVAAVATHVEAQAPTCPERGAESAAGLQESWILTGWEKEPGDGQFDFREKLGRFYHWVSPDVVLYDDFDPQFRVARSAEAYASIWTAPFTALTSAKHRVIDGPDAVYGRDYASTTLEFAARLEGADGQTVGIRTRSSLVWQCTSTGWRIVREHNSSRRITKEELGSLIP